MFSTAFLCADSEYYLRFWKFGKILPAICGFIFKTSSFGFSSFYTLFYPEGWLWRWWGWMVLAEDARWGWFRKTINRISRPVFIIWRVTNSYEVNKMTCKIGQSHGLGYPIKYVNIMQNVICMHWQSLSQLQQEFTSSALRRWGGGGGGETVVLCKPHHCLPQS